MPMGWGDDFDGGVVTRGKRPPGAPSEYDIERFIEERNDARKGGNFQRADEIREYLKAKGRFLESLFWSSVRGVVLVVLGGCSF